jgi:hypothetical protein
MKILKFTLIARANNKSKNNNNSKMMTDIYKSLEEKLRPNFSQPGQYWIGVGGGPGSRMHPISANERSTRAATDRLPTECHTKYVDHDVFHPEAHHPCGDSFIVVPMVLVSSRGRKSLFFQCDRFDT